MDIYLVTETDTNQNQVPEIWDRVFQSNKDACNAVVAYATEIEWEPDYIEQIKEDLPSEGFIQLDDKGITFTVQAINIT